MSLHARLRNLEAQLMLAGRCRVCSHWPHPVVRFVDAGDPAAEEAPPHTACPSCGWRFSGIHTNVIAEQVPHA